MSNKTEILQYLIDNKIDFRYVYLPKGFSVEILNRDEVDGFILLKIKQLGFKVQVFGKLINFE